ncbi:hypothetical protein NX059_011152 [Plenodomus lindquistii]|nr:hypothetical protein NX059_011152 [Plenodomus lindquistii]
MDELLADDKALLEHIPKPGWQPALQWPSVTPHFGRVNSAEVRGGVIEDDLDEDFDFDVEDGLDDDLVDDLEDVLERDLEDDLEDDFKVVELEAFGF